ncbi:DUF2278 family protein [Paraburkholderia silvatlantica]|uniref:Uncharacterized protein YukJ n=1 Tax=Paraburkholderia silvatlantica TaxID=321895 RepID=A0ABR6FIA2_9BURK|nr:DUF2278 family protein [Paraburkholderia silvatlantica]MBB2926837.1 uncharacterized protein YukJ [Paraburkholderia silvatlantica]PVY37537.1 uncharacterized protein DUF2278 [Paraburkholderia silvatlantica]PXW42499.1 uncharacterized protein DUF2278 [Paraburkholderia silvatlantica]
MALPYGYVKAKIVSAPQLKATRRPHEVQYHLHFGVTVNGARWDIAVNVGTTDADDLLKYKLVFDFNHNVITTLEGAAEGSTDLTGTEALPAIDFQRSDFLANTGAWRNSDVMDGSDQVEPVASLQRLLLRAQQSSLDVYVFGRFYSEGDGIHDVHMNQGSKGEFIHKAGNDANDHNDIWQDGALLVDLGDPEWALYVAAFDQQYVPTDDLGNPTPNSQPIS